MDLQQLKTAAEKIGLSDEAKLRIKEKCLQQLAAEEYEAGNRSMADVNMKQRGKQKNHKRMKHILAAAAVLLFVFCLPVVGMAVGDRGIFRDVIRWDGAVVGTEYEAAPGELQVSAEATDGEVLVTVTLLTPDIAPYCVITELAMGRYRLLDAADSVVLAADDTAFVDITEGKAVFSLPASSLAPGVYRLEIDGFVGGAKADQPLPILFSCGCELEL